MPAGVALPFPEARPFFALPPGYGFHRYTVPELKELPNLLGQLQIWQLPRRGHRYIIGVDVADGLGGQRDYSAIEVMRMGTVEEPEEQVAQVYSNVIGPSALAYLIDAIGHLYPWPDGREAMVAIECNNHGLSTQDTLQLHLGYRHFYIWEVLDQADPNKRFTTKMGWATTSRSRPILLDQFHTAVTTIDPLSGYSDLRINSTFTLDEMRDFQTEGALWEAEAAKGAHDDSILACAIAHYVAHRLQAGESEPLSDRRRRRREEELRRQRAGSTEKLDYRNGDSTADQMNTADPRDPEDASDGGDEHLYYDPDGRGYGGTLY